MPQRRNGSGRFGEKFRDQDLLQVFDYADDPMLTASEVADGLRSHFGIGVTTEAVRRRLHEMEEKDLVMSKEFGSRAIGWHALVAPALAEDVAERVDTRREMSDSEFVPLDK